MGLTLGPLVPVDPDLAWVGEVRTDLDEAVTELGVVDIEVVGAHPPVGLVETERRWPAVVVTPRSRKDRLELLGHTDGHHGGPGCGLEVGRHDVDVAITLLEMHNGNVVLLGEDIDGLAEPVAHLFHHRGRGDHHAQVTPHEAHHLARGLEVRHVGVQVDPVEALEIEHHMVIEQVVHVDDGGHGAPPP